MADGNVYAYDASRDASVDPQFPPLKGDLSAPSVTPGRREGSNPFARWHLSAGALTCAAFTAEGARVAVSGSDGLCRVLDVSSWERRGGGGASIHTQPHVLFSLNLKGFDRGGKHVFFIGCERW